MEQRKKKILVADDDPAILDVLQIFLEEVGYEVEVTGNGATLRDFQDGRADLLLLDIWLSGWNGRDICANLKSQEATKRLPIILFSANKGMEKSARAAGAEDFLAKPFELDELLEKIERYL
ncbi:MAG TPA: response regulator [Ktedonobacteraceae bacterium]|nr:response regulator [Ktedonobacteraceae bacterium]